MSLYTVDDKNPQRVDKFSKRQKIYIQVVGPLTIRLATTKTELQIPGSTGQNDGLEYTQANTTSPAQPAELEWCGELWAMGSGPNATFRIIAPGHKESTG